MRKINYLRLQYAEPSDIQIERPADMSKDGRYSEEDWNALLEKARLVPQAHSKTIYDTVEPSEEEKAVHEMYYGDDRPSLSIDESGKIIVHSGRRRMQALKEAVYTTLSLIVQDTLWLIPIRIENGEVVVEEKNTGYFKPIASNELNYLLIEYAMENEYLVNRGDYSPFKIKDWGHGESFLVIDKRKIDNPDKFEKDIRDWLTEGIKIFAAAGNVKED